MEKHTVVAVDIAKSVFDVAATAPQLDQQVDFVAIARQDVGVEILLEELHRSRVDLPRQLRREERQEVEEERREQLRRSETPTLSSLL